MFAVSIGFESHRRDDDDARARSSRRAQSADSPFRDRGASHTPTRMRARPLALARSIARARPSARRPRSTERATTMDARDGGVYGDVAKCLDATWTPLGLATRELRLKHTLPTGQSFRWRARGREDGREYVGVVGRRVVRVREVDDGERGEVEYKVYCRPRWESATDDRRVMREYFNADVSLEGCTGSSRRRMGGFERSRRTWTALGC